MRAHAQSVKEVLKNLNTSIEGLTPEEANRRLGERGRNIISKGSRKTSSIHIFVKQWVDPLILILCLAGIVSYIMGEYLDAYIILGTAFVNSLIGFIQENKANNAFEKLQSMVRFEAVVMRGGEKYSISSEEIVVGDILYLSAGDKVQADARIVSLEELEVNESALTGEADSVKKQSGAVMVDVTVGDRKSMIHRGTIVTNGEAVVVVTATGLDTELGQIATLVEETQDEQTPLQVQLGILSRQIGVIVSVIIVLVVVLGHLSTRADYTFLELFQTAVALAVAAIPEGLAISLTVVLAIGMQAILKRGSLVRKLVAAETLGSVTIICTDKTGTLTAGKMRVETFVSPGYELSSDAMSEMSIDITRPRDQAEEALLMGVLTNSASIQNREVDRSNWQIIGDTTDGALLYAGEEVGIDTSRIGDIYREVARLPFSSERMYMASMRAYSEGGILAVKGAPEVILEMCGEYYADGIDLSLDDTAHESILAEQDRLTKAGYRVIAVARKRYSHCPDGIAGDMGGLVFLGLFALRDPLRADVIETIRIARGAGIRVVMITGDHANTAYSIARSIGLVDSRDQVMEGRMVETLSLVDMKSVLSNIKVFARVEPRHKVRIVESLQSMGETVAMTGDGVNDAPALKGADIGVALGSGSDVAKETADLVLLDDSFSTIVSSIEEGRRIYDNIKKVVLYLVSGSFLEVFIVIGSIIIGLPVAILPVQILWVNIVQDTFPNIALAFDRASSGSMALPPRRKGDRLMDRRVKVMTVVKSVFGGLVFLSLFIYIYRTTGDIDLARTMVFVGLGVDALIFIFSMRNLHKPIWHINPFSNLHLLGAVAFGWFMIISAVHFPPFSVIMRTEVLSLSQWLLVLCVGVFNTLVLEAVKVVFIYRENKKI
jgi:P-type Ca2+ transporter type 2C